MCHWVLRIWECGDSSFTKYSSCSFDRAVQDPNNNLLNPLHPSITPSGFEKTITQARLHANRPMAAQKYVKSQPTPRSKYKRRSMVNSNNNIVTKSSGNETSNPSLLSAPDLPIQPQRGLSKYCHTPTTLVPHEAETVFPRDTITGETIPVPLSEIGKASRFGDEMLEEKAKCNVFEVVLQSKEPTVCPACARSPRRARLPAHARGCFGLS